MYWDDVKLPSMIRLQKLKKQVFNNNKKYNSNCKHFFKIQESFKSLKNDLTKKTWFLKVIKMQKDHSYEESDYRGFPTGARHCIERIFALSA